MLMQPRMRENAGWVVFGDARAHKWGNYHTSNSEGGSVRGDYHAICSLYQGGADYVVGWALAPRERFEDDSSDRVVACKGMCGV